VVARFSLQQRAAARDLTGTRRTPDLEAMIDDIYYSAKLLKLAANNARPRSHRRATCTKVSEKVCKAVAARRVWWWTSSRLSDGRRPFDQAYRFWPDFAPGGLIGPAR